MNTFSEIMKHSLSLLDLKIRFSYFLYAPESTTALKTEFTINASRFFTEYLPTQNS